MQTLNIITDITWLVQDANMNLLFHDRYYVEILLAKLKYITSLTGCLFYWLLSVFPATLKCVSSIFTYFLRYSETEGRISSPTTAMKWKEMAAKGKIGRQFCRRYYEKNSKQLHIRTKTKLQRDTMIKKALRKPLEFPFIAATRENLKRIANETQR